MSLVTSELALSSGSSALEKTGLPGAWLVLWACPLVTFTLSSQGLSAGVHLEEPEAGTWWIEPWERSLPPLSNF